MDAMGVYRRRVRVWFGEYVIADQTAEPALAQRYAEAMTRRFQGLRVTNEPIEPTPEGEPIEPQPSVPSDPRLWPTTVHLGVQD